MKQTNYTRVTVVRRTLTGWLARRWSGNNQWLCYTHD